MHLSETPQEWLSAMRATLGPMPRNYIVPDTETSGVDVNTDYVLQLAYLAVKDSQIVSRACVYLGWVGAGLVDGEWLRNRMEWTRSKMRERGEEYRLDYDQIRAEGVDPRPILTEFAAVLQQAIDNNWYVLGHNYIRFDAALLGRHLGHCGLAGDLVYADGLVLDTGAFEKGRQLLLTPGDGEHRIDFANRVSGYRARVKWKLGGHCAETYGLFKRANMTADQLHDAMDDCILTHHLFEAQRELLEGASPC